jgi:MFS family permease
VSALPGDETSLRYHGWRVVLACFVMAVLAWGFGFYGHGFYLAELQRLHGWPAALISSASTGYYLLSAVLVAFVSDAIRRLGVTACVIVGTLAFASSAAALPFIDRPWQLFAVYLVMAFGWATMSLGAINNILGLWFRRRRGLAISLALNGASFGGVIVVPGLVFLAAAQGFAVAMLSGAVVILLLALPLALGVLRMPAPRAHTEGASASDAPPAWTRRSALADPAFRGVTAFTALALFSQAGFLVHQIAFLESILGRTSTGLAVAITTAMAIVGRLLLGTVVDRLNQRRASALSLLSQAGALAVMALSTDSGVLLAACAVYGFSVGNLITFPSLIIQREFEAASFGLLIGLSTAVSQFTYAFGPGTLGLLRDAAGGYWAAIALCIALNLTAAAVVLEGPRAAPPPPSS